MALAPITAALQSSSPWAGWPGPDTIKVKKRTMPNPFNVLPRTGFGNWDSYIGDLEKQKVDPAALYKAKAEPMIASAAAEDDATAGDIVANRLGPAFAAQYRARAGQNLAANLGQAAGASQLEATDANVGILSQLLNAALGKAGVEQGDRGQDYGHFGDILSYLIGL